ncbi:hypothetical protein [Microbulbifer sp. 2205BS26-8]|uniref:hypothetical protein n=1 Tax=Microbulbifer sp. 2205BS26-8 TaxID=3064386 RepID=UPI00273DAC36|nr:hypothetical protein [Microbulbifer sp. 2205BS26-8]MDP5210194.1 hypothetical protein [Microbulbifer sp. 2205BS26-8]
MHLRIFDKTGSETVNDLVEVEVELTGPEESWSYCAEYFQSELTNNFRKLLSWYFGDYEKDHEQTSQGDMSTIDKFIRLGKRMGDNLLGEDHELIKLIEMIEETGFEQLQVSLESERVAFFSDCWEALVLPESKFVLSAVAKGFTRRFAGSSAALSDVHYQLGEDNPLKVLHVVSRPSGINQNCRETDVYSAYLSALSMGKSCQYEILRVDTKEDLLRRLMATDGVHIVHYDGPIQVCNDGAFLLIGEEIVDFADLTASKAWLTSTAVILGATDYQQPNHAHIWPQNGLARTAKAANAAGINNIIGFSCLANPWTLTRCIDAVYQGVFSGLSLGQSIVEARKRLQQQLTSHTFVAAGIPFQSWPLLVHYGHQEVFFFDQARALTTLFESESYADIRRRMHGFNSEFIPPFLSTICDGEFTRLLLAQKAGKALWIRGQSGSGKTQQLHLLALYHLTHNADYGFFFDLSQYSYHREDIINMIAPIVKQTENADIEELLTKRQVSCLFVFDNVGSCKTDRSDSSGDRTDEYDILDYARLLASYGHQVAVTTSAGAEVVGDDSRFTCIDLPKLSIDEQRKLVSEVMQKASMDETTLGNHYKTVMSAVDGNVFLAKKIFPALAKTAATNINDKLSHLSDLSKKYSGDPVKTFCEWQWQNIDRCWQRMAIILSDLPGVLLEMIGTAFDRSDKFLPAKELLEQINNGEKKSDMSFMSIGIPLLRDSGFLVAYPHGHVMNAYFDPFFDHMRAQDCFFANNIERLELLVSQIVCEAVANLIPHMLQLERPEIVHNLLANRRLWTIHLERLWFAADFTGFFRMETTFIQLLRKKRLEAELCEWLIDLIARTLKDEDFIGDLHASALLQLGGQAIILSRHSGEEVFAPLGHWSEQYFKSLVERHDNPLLESGDAYTLNVRYLELYYQLSKNWMKLKELEEASYKLYSESKDFVSAAGRLALLLHCSITLDEQEQYDLYVKILFEYVTSGRLPSQHFHEIVIKVLAEWCNVTNGKAAQALLDRSGSVEGFGQFEALYQRIQADIYFIEENYHDAAVVYCQIWQSLGERQQLGEMKLFAQRMIHLQEEDKLGHSDFNEIYSNYVNDDIETPKLVMQKFGITLH